MSNEGESLLLLPALNIDQAAAARGWTFLNDVCDAAFGIDNLLSASTSSMCLSDVGMHCPRAAPCAAQCWPFSKLEKKARSVESLRANPFPWEGGRRQSISSSIARTLPVPASSSAGEAEAICLGTKAGFRKPPVCAAVAGLTGKPVRGRRRGDATWHGHGKEDSASPTQRRAAGKSRGNDRPVKPKVL